MKYGLKGKEFTDQLLLRVNKLNSAKVFLIFISKSYEQIIEGNDFCLEEAKPSIEIVHRIRNAELSPVNGNYHALVKFSTINHPFKNGNR